MYYKYKDTSRLKVRGWKNSYHENINNKKIKNWNGDINIKVRSEQEKLPEIKNNLYNKEGSTCQYDMTILNVYVPNNSYKNT